MPKDKNINFLEHFPYDENGITSLLFLEESWGK